MLNLILRPFFVVENKKGKQVVYLSVVHVTSSDSVVDMKKYSIVEEQLFNYSSTTGTYYTVGTQLEVAFSYT